jgi:hypothetical protein
MAVIFQGNVEFDLKPGSKAVKNEFGLDVLTRVYYGYTNLVPQFLKSRPKYSSDFQYKSMALVSFEVEDKEGQMSEITLTYKGILFGFVNYDAIVTRGVRLMAGTAKNPKKGDPDVSFQYYATTTNYKGTGAAQTVFAGLAVPTNQNSTGRVGLFNFKPIVDITKLQIKQIPFTTESEVSQQGLYFTNSLTISDLLIDDTVQA